MLAARLRSGIGRTAVALKAARVAFEHSLSLEAFRAVQAWAGANWHAIRKDLLAHLARALHAYDRIRIYLSEGLIDEAVHAAVAQPVTGCDLQR
jgi:hypothetical protein